MVNSQPNDQDFFTQHCIIVDGRTDPVSPGSARTQLVPSQSRCVAVVDRTAMTLPPSSSNVGHGSISQAARDIVRARFSFNGKSPYAPDLVLVNEFVLEEFCLEAARYATSLLASVVKSSVNESKTKPASHFTRSKSSDTTSLETRFQHVEGVSTLVSGSRGRIVHVQKR